MSAPQAGNNGPAQDRALATGYWRDTLALSIPTLPLPTDFPRRAQRSGAMQHVDRQLSATLPQAGDDDRLLAACAVLLHRLTGEQDIAIGVPGHVDARVLPLLLSFDPTVATFDTMRDDVARQRALATSHADIASGELCSLAGLDAGSPPAGLTAARFGPSGTDGDADDWYELGFERIDNGEGITLRCRFDADLFETATVSRWLDALDTLLAAGLSTPDAVIGSLPMASATQLDALHALQPAGIPRRHGECIPDMVWAQAASTPERIAVTCQGTRWTYAELVRRAERIAQLLQAQDVGEGDLVGISLERTPLMVAAVLGTLRAGAAYVPLDPAYPRDRLEYMAADADLRLLLAETATADALSWPQDRTLMLDRVDFGSNDAAVAVAVEHACDAESPAYVIYTSGSTGKPKGVSVPHRAVANFLHSMAREPGLGADDRLLAVTTLSFDIAVLELFLPLATGAEIVLASREEAMDGWALARLLADHDATVMQATPATWRMLLEAGWQPAPGFKSLCGGEALPADLLRSLTANGAALWNMYGPTETTVWSTCERVDASDAYISIGRPIDNTTVWILDPFLNPCPVGVPGEIWIGGTGVTLGYLNRAELTAERFIDDPVSKTPGLLYRTGDRGRWRNDGRLEHLGRLDFQVKVRGYRIELGEIESNLASFPGIGRNVVITREDQPGDVRIVAYLVMQAGHAPDPQALRQHLRASLPEYMVPQHFVALPAIPLLPNGKVDRKSLPAPAAAATTLHRRAPANDIERQVAETFAQVLGVDAIGVDENFFSAGGHSLLAAKVAAALGRAFGVPVPLHVVFEASDAASLSARIAALVAEPGRAGHAAPAHVRRDTAPATLMQERLWIHGQLQPDSVAYNIPIAYRLRGQLDPKALADAINAVVDRQASLRSALRQEPDGLALHVSPSAPPVQLQVDDLSALPPDQRARTLDERFESLSKLPIDLASPHPFHARLFRLDDTEWALFFMPHHALWDGGSTERFTQEMAASCAAVGGRPATESALEFDYADFAIRHREQIAEASFAARKAERAEAWRHHFESRGLPAKLPTDRPRDDTPARSAATARIDLPGSAVDALRAFAREHDATLYTVALTAFLLVLHRFSGERSPLVGSPVRVVDEPGFDPLMGMFTSVLPVAVDIGPATDFPALLGQARGSIIAGLSSLPVQLDDLLREPDLRAFAGEQLPYMAQFSFEDVRDRPAAWGDLQVEQLALLPAEPTEDLMLWVFEHSDHVEMHALYDAALFDAGTIDEVLQTYAGLLERLPSDARQAVSSLLQSGGPDHAQPPRHNDDGKAAASATASSHAAQPAAPLTPAEQLLADVWKDLLGVDEIPRDGNFFDLGGHSLLAMTMVTRVEKQTGIRLNLLKVANGSLMTLAMALPSAVPAKRSLADRIKGLFGARDEGTTRS